MSINAATLLGRYEYVNEQRYIPAIIEDAKRFKIYGIDTENSGGLDPLSDTFNLLLFQIAFDGRAFVIDARTVDLFPFKDILGDSSRIKIAHNMKYDYKALKIKKNITICGMYCTKIGEFLLTAGISIGENHLENLALKYLDHQLNKNVTKTFFEHHDEPFTKEQLDYAADDVLCLQDIRRRQIIYHQQYSLESTMAIENNLIGPVADMEIAGIAIDSKKWRTSLDSTHKKLFKISTDLRQILPNPPSPPPKPVRLKKDGTPCSNNAAPKPPPILNLDSWQQLAWACNEIGIDLEQANKKTRKGVTNSTTMKFAKKMYSNDDTKRKVLDLLGKYRGLKQTEKTFGDNLLEFAKRDGRIHCEFDQIGTESGRFSSKNPNLQNIQKKGEEGKILRSCFVPAPSCKFIIADYSQIELRIAAELSKDKGMLYTLCLDKKADIHKSTASMMYGIPPEKVTDAIRRAAKTINFGIIYGMMEYTLAERLGCTKTEAEEHMNAYRKAYSGLMDYLDRVSEAYYKRGYAATIEGRRRWYPTLDPKKFDTWKEYNSRVEFFKRVSKNEPIQGTSADMTKLAIILLSRLLHRYDMPGRPARIVNTVHDELCVEAPVETAGNVAKLVNDKMVEAGERYLKTVPVLVDTKIRDNWYKNDDIVHDNYEGQQLTMFDVEDYDKR